MEPVGPTEPTLRVEPVDDQRAADLVRAKLERRIIAFNEAATGHHDGRILTFVVRDGDAIVAGLDGFTWGGYARVEYLFVDEARRGAGLGRALMDSAEHEARERGCDVMTLDTHEFQAPGFYERLGFTRAGTTVDTPRSSAQHQYWKRIAD